MTLGEIVLLGVIQGLTEFLPVSSSGHLVAGRLVFNIPDTEGLALDAFLHLGTLLAVLVYFREKWLALILGWHSPGKEGKKYRSLMIKLIIATVPAVLIGWWLKDWADLLRSPVVVATGLVITAVALWISERSGGERGLDDGEVPRTNGRALGIGLAQVMALVPGISRSGMTIAAGRRVGLSNEGSVVFSFLMSVPVIAGAGVVNLAALGGGAISAAYLGAGFFASFLAGWVAISLMLKMVRRMSLKPFVVYLLGLAIWLMWYGS